jgi:NAD(P)-dependent dehydrogenase (short-subunit alcohol dehydrogenase family)
VAKLDHSASKFCLQELGVAYKNWAVIGKLAEKVVLVTGGAEGIGRGIARAFAEQGAKVLIADVNRMLGEALVVQTERRVSFQQCDVSNPAEVAQLVDGLLAQEGRVDVLVNNAGVALGPMPVFEMSTEQMWRQVAVNQLAMLYTFKHVIPAMIRQRAGTIINLASMQAHVGVPGWTAYAGTKGAAIAMTQQLAIELAPHGIRVNSISPGAIRTEMNERIVSHVGDHVREIWKNMHPLGRIGETDEVAAAAVFLASDDSSFVTGVDLKVDGGVTLQTRDVPAQGKAHD